MALFSLFFKLRITKRVIIRLRGTGVVAMGMETFIAVGVLHVELKQPTKC